MKTPPNNAIMHLDGDAFFASVEQAMNPSFRGKPLVSGGERGVATAVSYEAKKLGVPRGMPIFRLRKLFPNVIVADSNYAAYSIFSKRMFGIVRRYINIVEEYSVDECFADLSSLKKKNLHDHTPLLEKIKSEIKSELGITVSLGLATSKVLAKVASKIKKPDGLTIIPQEDSLQFLSDIQVGKVWGIGPATSLYLQKLGIKTAAELASQKESWIKDHTDKHVRELWSELNGISVLPIDPLPKIEQKSIMKTRTFYPPSADKSVLYSEISKNLESACFKARSYALAPRAVRIYLKTTEFKYSGCEIFLPLRTNSPSSILKYLKPEFEKLWTKELAKRISKKESYRATGVIISDLKQENIIQEDFFGQSDEIKKQNDVFETVDALNAKFGGNSVYLGSSGISVEKKKKNKEKISQGQELAEKLSVPFLGFVD